MEIVYVGLDLGSSSFHPAAIKADGSIALNRIFTTSEANLRKAFSDFRGVIHVHLEAGELAPWAASVIAPDQPRRNFKQLVQHYYELTAHQERMKTKLKARLRMQGVIVTGERLF